MEPITLAMIATLAITKVFEKTGEILGEKAFEEASKLLSLLKRKAPDTANAIELAQTQPLDYGQAVLIGQQVEEVAKKDPEIAQSIEALANEAQPQLTTAIENWEGINIQGGTTISGQTLNFWLQSPEERVKLNVHTAPPQNLPLSGVVEFVGRAEELQNLHQLLQQNQQVAIAAIAGMGGVGKTELALQYATQHRDTYKGGICWLLPKSGDVGVQIVQFARTQLDLNPPSDFDLLAQVQYCFRHWREGEVLLVVDDVFDYQEVKHYLPSLSSRFKILITTRQHLGRIAELSLDVLQPEAALELLNSIIGVERVEQENNRTPQVALQLCEWLGYLPLGLELVGRYLEKKRDLSLKAILQRLEEKGLGHSSLSSPAADMTARRGILASFQLSWEELDDKARQLGCLLSMFSLTPIFWSEVEEIMRSYSSSRSEEFNPEELEDARDNLIALHLFERIQESTYRLHPLVRQFLRSKLETLPQGSELKQIFTNPAFNIHRITKVSYSILITTVPKIISIGGEPEVLFYLSRINTNNDNAYILEIPHNEAIANELNIIINAPGFQLNGDNTASLPLDPDIAQETQTARFRLTALRPGSATITAELYRGDTFETKLETQIQVTDIDEASFTPQRITAQPRPVPQPDFILRIQTIWSETNSTYKFQYQLKSFRFPSLFPSNNIFISDSFSSNWLEQTRGLLATTLENISGSLPTEGKSRLISLGGYLFKQIFSTELQSVFSSLILQNSTFTLLIVADQEAWIPWELLYDGQRFFAERFIIGRWLQELNNSRPYEFPVGTVNVAHYANVEQPQLWSTLLEAPGAPPPQPLPAGVLHDSTEAMRGLHLIRYSQSSDADLRNAPVTLDNINDTEDIELQMRPAKLNLRRNRPFVTLSYVKTDAPELTALENTWASAFIRAGCSGFMGSLWAVEPAVEAAFISCFYNRLWAGASLSEAFYTSRQLARVAAPDSLDWLAYVLFGDPMARPYRPVPGDGYAIVEPIGREIDDPLPPGAIARFRVTLRRNPPVWHEDRVIEVAENLLFENLQVHIVTYGLQVIPDLPVTMTLTAKGDYLGWFTLVVPNEITDTSALVQVYFADGMRPIHSLNFSLNIENGREE